MKLFRDIYHIEVSPSSSSYLLNRTLNPIMSRENDWRHVHVACAVSIRTVYSMFLVEYVLYVL